MPDTQEPNELNDHSLKAKISLFVLALIFLVLVTLLIPIIAHSIGFSPGYSVILYGVAVFFVAIITDTVFSIPVDLGNATDLPFLF
jgi:magnesium-transporting ATPase (P-type)